VLQCLAVFCSLLRKLDRGAGDSERQIFLVFHDLSDSTLEAVMNDAHLQLFIQFKFLIPKKMCVAVCCSVLQCVAVCCSVLQFVAVCCSVLQRVAACCSVLWCVAVWLQCGCSVLQCIVVRCRVLDPIRSDREG